MTEQKYTPTTDEVKADYLNMQVFLADDNDTEANYRAVMQWSRWIAEHDRQVAERAWDEGQNAGELNALAPYVSRWRADHAPVTNPYRKGASND